MVDAPVNWRTLRGLPLMIHEIKHPGNRPFAIGFGLIFLGSMYAQKKFTDEMKANSDYWQKFHAKKAGDN